MVILLGFINGICSVRIIAGCGNYFLWSLRQYFTSKNTPSIVRFIIPKTKVINTKENVVNVYLKCRYNRC